MNGLFMINDPGVGSIDMIPANCSAGVQVNTRFFTSIGGASNQNQRYIDILSNGDTVPASIISTTISVPVGLFSYFSGMNIQTLRLVYFYLASGGNNNLVRWSDDLGTTWNIGTFSSRQARGGFHISKWNKWIGWGLTGSGSPYTGQFFNSTDDAANWTLKQSLTSTNIYFTHGAYSPSLNIAVVANAGTATKNCAYWSTDGDTWYAGTFSGASFNPQEGQVIWQPKFSTFLLTRNGSNNTNSFAISTDGKNWDPITATGISPIGTALWPLAVAHNPISGRTVVGLQSGASSGSVFYYSDDGGYNWTLSSIASAVWFLEGGRYDLNTNTWIFSTRYHGSGDPNINGFFLSKNGVNWTYYSQANAGVLFTNFTLPLP